MVSFLGAHRFTQVPSKDSISEILNLIQLLTFQSPLTRLTEVNKKDKLCPTFEEAENWTNILKGIQKLQGGTKKFIWKLKVSQGII